MLTLPEKIDISSVFGKLDFVTLNTDSNAFDPYTTPMTNGYSHSQTKSEDDDFIVVDSTSTNNNANSFSNSTEHILSPPSLSSISNMPKKRLLWQIEYFSVPYYVRVYESQLFICDKYGLIILK